ncbi:MAG TPA: hypothetical protein PLK14_09975 [Sediminibacterium sp.]|nr:hypothetical protein [Sediminibacterium sp.]
MRTMEEQKELIRYAIITGIKYVGLSILVFYIVIYLFFWFTTRMVQPTNQSFIQPNEIVK